MSSNSSLQDDSPIGKTHGALVILPMPRYQAASVSPVAEQPSSNMDFFEDEEGSDDHEEGCTCKDHEDEEDELSQRVVPWPIFPGTPNDTQRALDLKKLPCRRDLALAPGKKWHPDGAGRARSHEAALGYCVGTIADASCGRCIDGIGPFARCIVVDGFFGDVCVGCYWAGCAEMCSFHIRKRAWNKEREMHFAEKSKRACESVEATVPVAAEEVEAFEARYAKLEIMMAEFKAEQERSRLERASIAAEAQTIEAAILHLRKESPQMVEVDGKFCVTREKAASLLLSVQAILWDLEA